MSVPETCEYLSSVYALKEEYKKEIAIYAGFEAEYFPDLFLNMMRTLSDYSFDYLILGSHFLGSEETGTYSGDETSQESQLEHYVNQTTEGLKTGVFTYLAHPDLINYTGPSEIYSKHMTRLCQAAKEADIPLEININGLIGKRWYPRRDFFSLAREQGNTIVLGVDAHDPHMFLHPEYLKEAESFAHDLGLTITEDIPLRRPYL